MDPEATVTHIPLLYIPSTWNPPTKFGHVEFAFVKFDERLNKMKQALQTHRGHNLLSLAQHNVISELHR
jgi:hypothetical protein